MQSLRLRKKNFEKELFCFFKRIPLIYKMTLVLKISVFLHQ